MKQACKKHWNTLSEQEKSAIREAIDKYAPQVLKGKMTQEQSHIAALEDVIANLSREKESSSKSYAEEEVSYRKKAEDSKKESQKQERLKVANDVVSKVDVSTKINVYDTVEEANKAIGFELDSDAKGFQFGDQIGIIASEHSGKLDVERTLGHEIFHAGIEKMSPRNSTKYENSLNHVAEVNGKIREAADNWLKDNKSAELKALKERGYTDEQANKRAELKAIEEAIADLAGENHNSSIGAFVASVQNIMRDIGLKRLATAIETSTDATALKLIRDARSAIESKPSISGASLARIAADNPSYTKAAETYTVAQAMKTIPARKWMEIFTRSDASFSLWGKSIGTQYHKALKNKDYGRVFWRVMESEDDIRQTAFAASQQAPNVLADINNSREALRRLVGKSEMKESDIKAAGEVLFSGTMEGGGDPLKGKVYSEKELREKGLNDQGIKAYKEMRGAIDQSLESLAVSEVVRMLQEQTDIDPDLMVFLKADSAQGRKIIEQVSKETKEKVDELVENTKADLDEAKKRNAGIQPATRDHNAALRKQKLWNDLTTKIDDTFERLDELKSAGYAPAMRFGKHVLRVMDGDEVVYRAQYENQIELNLAKTRIPKWLKENGLNQNLKVESFVQDDESFKQLQGVSPETLMLFAEKLGLSTSEAAQAYYQEAVSTRSALKRKMRRLGIPGYSDDASRVLASFITSNARQASKNYNSRLINKELETLPENDVKAEASKLVESVNNPTEAGAQIRSLMFAYFIGGSVSSAMVNLIDPIMNVPIVLSEYGNIGGSYAKQLSGATAALKDRSKMNTKLRASFEEAERKGLVDPQSIHFLYNESIRGLAANKRVQAAMHLWAAPFAMAENFNRKSTFIAAHELYEGLSQEKKDQIKTDKGISDAYEFAEQVLYDVNGIYNKSNKANWARGAVGGVFLTFKQFTIQRLELYKRLPMKQRAMMAAMLVLAAGAYGLPGAEDAIDIYDTLGQMMGYQTNAKKSIEMFATELLGKELSPIVLQGLSNATPIDLSGRLGMGNIIPSTALLKISNENTMAKNAGEVVGPIGGMVDAGLNGWKALSRGEIGGAMTEVAPLAIKNFIKGIEIAKTGEAKDGRGNLVANDMTVAEGVGKALGFQPTIISEKGRDRRNQIQDEAQYKAMSSTFTEKLAQAIAKGDTSKVDEVIQDIETWNKKNPEWFIAPSNQTIDRRVKEIMTPRDQRALSKSPNNIRATMQERYQ